MEVILSYDLTSKLNFKITIYGFLRRDGFIVLRDYRILFIKMFQKYIICDIFKWTNFYHLYALTELTEAGRRQ